MSKEDPLSKILDIPDLLWEVLLRVPATRIERAVNVCLSWGNMIKSEEFIARHLQRNKKQHFLLRLVTIPPVKRGVRIGWRDSLPLSSRERYSLLSDESQRLSEYRVLNFPYTSESQNFHTILGTHNGLICLHASTSDNFILWNPSLQRSVVVTSPSPSPSPDVRSAYNLQGFAYLESSNDYKIVRMQYVRGDGDQPVSSGRVCVYSLRTRSWQTIELAPPRDPLRGTPSVGSLNGAVHWLAGDGILVFDLGSEIFRVVLLPGASDDDDGDCTWDIKPCRGSFLLIQSSRKKRSSTIWEMSEVGDWLVKFVVPRAPPTYGVLGFVSDPKEVVISQFRELGGPMSDLYLYNSDFRSYYDPLWIFGVGRFFYLDSYKESIVLINFNNEGPGERGLKRRRE